MSDVLNALGGSDRVIGTDANETLSGGAGNDYIDARAVTTPFSWGTMAFDRLLGGAGNDILGKNCRAVRMTYF